MSVKPIDLQTNMTQMLEVGRAESAKAGAIAEQQHQLDQEAAKKSRDAKEKLEETRKGDRRSIQDNEKHGSSKGRGEHHHHDEENEKKEDRAARVSDERMGKIIDVFK